MLDGSLSYKHTTVSSSKKAMDCVQQLCISHMSGTDKWKVMVIGKRAWCFKGFCMDSLSVLYYGNNNAWMTSETFKK
jgi:hypothetical protein